MGSIPTTRTMNKRTCPRCGNNKKRDMEYVDLYGEYVSQVMKDDPHHWGYKCKKCDYFWEVTNY